MNDSHQIMNERVFKANLGAAASKLDGDRVRAECQELIASLRKREKPFPEQEAVAVLGVLRKWKYFDLLRQVADVLIQGGQDAPPVQRQYAQALIDQGFLIAAISILQHLVLRTTADPHAYSEARGLLGRAYKQVYFDAREPRSRRHQQTLRRAILAYYEVYVSGPDEHLWHGINTAALLAYADRHGIPMDGLAKPSEIAVQLRDRVSRKGRGASAWDLATAMEACLVTHEWDEALKWAKAYVEHPDADAFALNGTLRQLEDVWDLDRDREAEGVLLSVLRAKLLEQENGHVELSSDDVRREAAGIRADSGQLEKVFGADAFKTYRWYQGGIARARSVALVEDQFGRGLGTGFLMRGGDLYRGLGDEQVLLTNAHVVSPTGGNALAIRADDAAVAFEALGSTRFSITEVLWSSPPEHLDVTVARLNATVPDVQPPNIAGSLPQPGSKKRIYVIGHPLGGTLSFSLHDNLYLGFKDPLIHYRTPTEPGSSGSPIFDDQWKLVGIHHAGSRQMRRLDNPERTYEANEGIYLHTIIKAFVSKYGA